MFSFELPKSFSPGNYVIHQALICLYHSKQTNVLLLISMFTFHQGIPDIPQFIVTTNTSHVSINNNMAHTYAPAHSLTHTHTILNLYYMLVRVVPSSCNFHSNLQPIIILIWDK